MNVHIDGRVYAQKYAHISLSDIFAITCYTYLVDTYM